MRGWAEGRNRRTPTKYRTATFAPHRNGGGAWNRRRAGWVQRGRNGAPSRVVTLETAILSE